MSSTQLGFEAKIVPELADKVAPVGAYAPHPDNPRTHNIANIQASLLEHGQRTEIVVQKSSGWIVKGNGTYEAILALGWTEAAFDVQEMDDDTAYGYMLADNKASDQSKYDRKKLIAGLEKMVAGPGLESTLWMVDELEDLISEEDAVPVAQVAAFQGDYNEPEESQAARAAAAAAPGDKRREIPLVFTLEQHAEFIGWLKTLQKRWNVKGTLATVYAAVKRQAEAEVTATAPLTGSPITEDVRVAERRAALTEFRDLIITLGADKEFRGTWLLGQLQGTIAAQKESAPVGGGTVAVAPVAMAVEEEGPAEFTEEALAERDAEIDRQFAAALVMATAVAESAPLAEEPEAEAASPDQMAAFDIEMGGEG